MHLCKKEAYEVEEFVQALRLLWGPVLEAPRRMGQHVLSLALGRLGERRKLLLCLHQQLRPLETPVHHLMRCVAIQAQARPIPATHGMPWHKGQQNTLCSACCALKAVFRVS